jgi:hypothetical protein
MRGARIVLLSLAAAACSSGGGGPTFPGRDLSASLRCEVCGVGTYTIEVGRVAAFTVDARSLSTGQLVDCPQATWTSDPLFVATVTGAGKAGTARGVGPGLARISVELECGAHGHASAEANILVVAVGA